MTRISASVFAVARSFLYNTKMDAKTDFIKKHAPCYIYSRNEIISNAEKLVSALPGVEFLYSVKANPFASVVRLLAELGFGSDSASVTEVQQSLDAGIDSGKIFFSSPGKTKDEILASYGKCVFVADSFSELSILERAATEHGEVLKVGVRLNPISGFSESEGASKFGIDEEQFFSSRERFSGFPHLEIAGIHVHLRSQVLDSQKLCEYYKNCFSLALRAQDFLGGKISFINFGSGIGTVYDFSSQSHVNLKLISQTFSFLQEQNKKTLGAKFYIESGRFLVCGAGKYYTPVVDIKESRGTKYLIVKNAMNGFLRPSLAEFLKSASGKYPEQGFEPLFTCGGEVSVRVLGSSAEKEKVTVAGNLCTAQDVIGRDLILNKAETGDLVEISNAGSYGYSLSPLLFSSFKAPEQILM